MDGDADERLMAASAGPRLALMAESFRRATGLWLAGSPAADAASLWRARRVIVAHGTEGDPIFFYGNRRALDLFEIGAADFLRMPSRLSAEAPERAERSRLFDRVARHGFIDDYAGVRISATGRRFRIEQAVVWTLTDDAGTVHGQAAAFDRWTRLD